MSDKKIIQVRSNRPFKYSLLLTIKILIQYDMNTAEITQEYDQHLGPVNTITFVDENRRFITTSDDKTMRAWDFDIPVVIKYIAEPDMHSMPAVTLHPSSKFPMTPSGACIVSFANNSSHLQKNGLQPSPWTTRFASTPPKTSAKIGRSASQVIQLPVMHAKLGSLPTASGSRVAIATGTLSSGIGRLVGLKVG